MFRFALMCSDLFENEEIITKHILKYLKMLLFDRVVNVRVTLSKVISELFTHKSKKINIIKINI